MNPNLNLLELYWSASSESIINTRGMNIYHLIDHTPRTQGFYLLKMLYFIPPFKWVWKSRWRRRHTLHPFNKMLLYGIRRLLYFSKVSVTRADVWTTKSCEHTVLSWLAKVSRLFKLALNFPKRFTKTSTKTTRERISFTKPGLMFELKFSSHSKWLTEPLRPAALSCVCLKITICIIAWKSSSLGN